MNNRNSFRMPPGRLTEDGKVLLPERMARESKPTAAELYAQGLPFVVVGRSMFVSTHQRYVELDKQVITVYYENNEPVLVVDAPWVNLQDYNEYRVDGGQPPVAAVKAFDLEKYR